MTASPLRVTTACATCIAWLSLLLVDCMWNDMLLQAVKAKTNTFGEMYGPLSFFRPLLLYAAMGMTAVCVLLMLMPCTFRAEDGSAR